MYSAPAEALPCQGPEMQKRTHRCGLEKIQRERGEKTHGQRKQKLRREWDSLQKHRPGWAAESQNRCILTGPRNLHGGRGRTCLRCFRRFQKVMKKEEGFFNLFNYADPHSYFSAADPLP